MLRAVGVHCFAGGFSLGFERHFTITTHLESGSLGVATWRQNRPGVPVITDRTGTWTDAIAEIRRTGRPDLVYGNPECSAFSRQNMLRRGVDRAALPKTKGISQVVRAGARLEARVIVIESVRDAMKWPRFFSALWNEVRGRYPASMWVLVNAMRHSVPQDRPRVFWVLAPERFDLRLDPVMPPALLEALAGIPSDAANQLALEEHAYVESWKHGAKACLPHLRPGKRLRDLPSQVLEELAPVLAERQKRRGKKIIHWPHRLDPKRPCPVIDRHVKQVHPEEHRMLTAREYARLSGFPDDFELMGGPEHWVEQLGRGVCPPVGVWIASEVAAYLRGERGSYGPGEVTIDRSGPHTRAVQLGLF
jgi:DNA (cytosine-5)-methyltransferase 1